MKFKENLKNLRVKNNLTQEQLSKKLEIATGTLRNWEQGIREPKLKDLEKIIIVLNCDYNELLQERNEVK